MKILLSICTALLFLALTNLPIGYFTLLRIVVTIGAIAVVVTEYKKNGINFWVVSFALIAIIFNPLIPIYLHDKDIWVIIDLIAAIIFGIKTYKVCKINNTKI